MDRVSRLASHLSLNPVGANEGPVPQDVKSLPLPPIATLAEGEYFPTFPQMLADSKRLGGVFSYEIIGGRRMTIIQDPELYEIVYSPHEMGMTPGIGTNVHVEMAKLAHTWFGIPRDISEHTNASLLSVRRRIGPSTVTDLADKVGKGVKQLFDSYGREGEIDLVKVAHATFWPVNEAMYGSQTLNELKTPGADLWFHEFDENIPQITAGIPLASFPESQAAYEKIVQMFQHSIEGKHHLDKQQCPVLHARLNVDDIPSKYTDEAMAKFMVSLFWAPQANTLPMTWWVLAEILRNPRIKKLVEEEVRGAKFAQQPAADGHYAVEDADLPYTRACMYEVFRLYIANLTHRKVNEDIPVRMPKTGQWVRIPKKDMLSVASYVRHWDPEVYDNPSEFRPERFLGAKKPGVGDFLPFSHGKYSCSGKFLAMLEIPILVALFFRDFDVELMDPVPEADWSNVVASVRPQGWPFNTNCRVKYVRRGA